MQQVALFISEKSFSSKQATKSQGCAPTSIVNRTFHKGLVTLLIDVKIGELYASHCTDQVEIVNLSSGPEDFLLLTVPNVEWM